MVCTNARAASSSEGQSHHGLDACGTEAGTAGGVPLGTGGVGGGVGGFIDVGVAVGVGVFGGSAHSPYR